MLVLLCFGFNQKTKSQAFLRLDSLRFTDSSCYYETTPYGPVYVDVTDSSANARVDTIKGYYVTFWGDTAIAPWKNAKTGSIDTILIAGNGKTNTWECLIANPKGIKLVRTNDSSTSTMKQTKIVIRGTERLYNGILKPSPFITASDLKRLTYRRQKLNDGIAVMPFGLNYYKPQRHKIFDKPRL